MSAPTKKLKKEEVEAKQPLAEPAAARGLEGAYDDDEPEYTLDMLAAQNPGYEGPDKKCASEKRECTIERRPNEGAYR